MSHMQFAVIAGVYDVVDLLHVLLLLDVFVRAVWMGSVLEAWLAGVACKSLLCEFKGLGEGGALFCEISHVLYAGSGQYVRESACPCRPDGCVVSVLHISCPRSTQASR